MYLSLIILPLLGSIISGFFGRKVGVTGSHTITCACVITTTLLSVISFFEVVSMLIPVLIVSSLVHIYSIGYMSHDPHNQRFFSYLSLFTFMMIILVTSNNFLLIIAANQSSLSAFLTNRVGDCFLTIDYSTVFSMAPLMTDNLITIIGICLLIGAMAKSSQIGLHSLIHAATMVTAGVYLLMRSSPLIEYSNTLQLGMMVVAIGLSSYNVALFHLVNHAFYKALLFLGAGAVIHAVSDNQDFRKYGGLKAFLPLTYSVMLIASLSLVAFPFMTGFYSKDFILDVLYLTFLTNPNGPLVNYKHAHEGDIFMSLPLIILAIFSIFFGYITKDMFIGLGCYNIFSFFNQRFLIEMFYNKYITDFVLKLGGQTTKVLDKGSIELLGPYGLEKGLIVLSKNISKLDTGVITSYALYILVGLTSYMILPYCDVSYISILVLYFIYVYYSI
ncbi:hypothetical protein CERZMDRAFT_115910 [Cercospora zeae-maydis SCOH1-5]|uniref:NADH:ubiquinone reductase (H(+)-translocating) n=1 Tax=Cercospora zeae-maydis SCOH1-5 TaxID=717836 RepID=A0A6A6EXL0_9PEZI|nr:hypothetical protein CERZMDRAFT_115910 [Cercospora zeae-maydis SCOH1-5]